MELMKSRDYAVNRNKINSIKIFMNDPRYLDTLYMEFRKDFYWNYCDTCASAAPILLEKIANYNPILIDRIFVSLCTLRLYNIIKFIMESPYAPSDRTCARGLVRAMRCGNYYVVDLLVKCGTARKCGQKFIK